LLFGQPKTSSGEARTVELDSGTVGVLLAHRLQQDLERAQWGEAYSEHGLVFAREDGVPIPPEVATKTFAELCKSAGVRSVRLHDLRHAGRQKHCDVECDGCDAVPSRSEVRIHALPDQPCAYPISARAARRKSAIERVTVTASPYVARLAAPMRFIPALGRGARAPDVTRASHSDP
jgi:hypothetical protein